MNTLEKMFHSLMKNALSFEQVGARLIARRLAMQGIMLDQEQLQKLESCLKDTRGDSLTVQLDIGAPVDGLTQGNMTLLLDDLDGADQVISATELEITNVLPEIIAKISDILIDQLKQNASAMLVEHSQYRQSFETRLFQHWGKALDLLEMLQVIACESGVEFNREFRPKAATANDYVFDALTKLHARACQVTAEILALLRAGFADGAHARWRTLHEITVTAFFVKQPGNDVAERYLLHEHIEARKAAREYQERCMELQQDPIPESEMAEIENAYQQLISRFGCSYGKNYGWAAAALDNNAPNFGHIEQAVDLGYLRPYYRLASHNVHANPKGISSKLGLSPGANTILLVGPSDVGLADPGHGAAISLCQITTALLTTKPNIDRLVLCQVMQKLASEIGDAFLAAHESSEEISIPHPTMY